MEIVSDHFDESVVNALCLKLADDRALAGVSMPVLASVVAATLDHLDTALPDSVSVCESCGTICDTDTGHVDVELVFICGKCLVIAGA